MKNWGRMLGGIVWLAMALLLNGPAWGGVPTVLDINTSAVGTRSVWGSFVKVGNTLYFSGHDGKGGAGGLWKSDGTGNGTVLVKENIFVLNICNVGGTLFFHGESTEEGAGLWKSDGTAEGTVLVASLPISDETSFTAVGDTLFFIGSDGDYFGLWKSNSAGTALVKEGIGPQVLMASVNGTLFFTAESETAGMELWKSDGTAAGTVMVRDLNPGSASSYPGELANLNGTLYFRANDGVHGYEVWKTDGSPAGTVLVKDSIPGAAGSDPTYLTSAGGTLFYIATGPGSLRALWKTDGTAAGTVLLKTADEQNIIHPLTAVDGAMYFVATDSDGHALWKTDGSVAGTVRVSPLIVSVEFGSWTSTTLNGTLYFAGLDDVGLFHLWKSDGTAAGTAEVREMFPEYEAFNNNWVITELNGSVVFLASDTEHGTELWRTDGSIGGTVLLRDLSLENVSSSPQYLTDVNGTLFFSANSDDRHGPELWKSDGTPGGTVLVKDLYQGGYGASLHSLAAVGSTLFFSGNDGVRGGELWKSNGTADGTVLVKEINPGPASGVGFTGFAALGETAYFSASNGTNGTELWKSDGTAAGTVMVADINPGAAESKPYGLTVSGGVLYFGAYSAGSSSRLWRSDGSPAGTWQVTASDGAPLVNPGSLTEVNGILFFTTHVAGGGWDLWRSDGTPTGTVLLKSSFIPPDGYGAVPVAKANGLLFFRGWDPLLGYSLWKSDGTQAGTSVVPGAGGANPFGLHAFNGAVFFGAVDPTSQKNFIWKSDGTAAGTVRIKEMVGGNFQSVGSDLFFIAQVEYRSELWRTDGTAAGTFPVKQLLSPMYYTSSGGKLFFTASHPLLGNELFVADPGEVTPPGALPTISGTPPASATVGVPFSFTPASTNGQGFLISGNLPPGLRFDFNTGTLSGTPTTAGQFAGITISAVNDSGRASTPAVTITVAPKENTPRYQLPQTGQTSCWDAFGTLLPSCAGTGQDGEQQTGTAWPDPRFTGADGSLPVNVPIVTDKLTGLQWVRNGATPSYGSCDGGPQGWQDALSYVRCLNDNSYLGHNDWRLPNINELASLSNREILDSATSLNAQGFADVQASYYWSSTTRQANPTSAWYVNLGDKYTSSAPKTNQFLVLPVRTGTFRGLPATDQVSCWDSYGVRISCAGTGQDGDTRAGVPWPAPRMTNPDQSSPVSGPTVYDRLTGLEWVRDPGVTQFGSCAGGKKSWQGALDYIACLNANNYLGHNDWRQPNVVEMASLFSREKYLWSALAEAGFVNFTSGMRFWTSDSYAPESAKAWFVGATNGITGIRSKLPGSTGEDLNYNVLPVRGGMIVPARPTITSVTSGSGQAQVAFTPPAPNGGAPVTSYLLTAQPGNLTATGAQSPITVTGLTSGVRYTLTLAAVNASGTGKAAKSTVLATDQLSVNGRCGSANGGTFTTSPSAGLCSAGTPSAVTGTGPLQWSCAGSGGGYSANCLAYLTANVSAPITTITPAGGSYSTGSILATLSCSSSSATIYYTTDGSTPTEQSAVYSAPIAVTGNKTIRYFARDLSGNAEPVRSATYSVTTGGPPAASITSRKSGTVFTVLRSEGGGAVTPVVTGTTTGTFTDSSTLKPNTVYEYQVVSDTDPTLTVLMTIRTPMYNGWNIVGVPYDTTGVSLSSLFGTSVSAIYEWVPTGTTPEESSSQLGSYLTRSAVFPGKGYFAKPSRDNTVLVYAGKAGLPSVSVTLKPGWTMIANPALTSMTNIGTRWLIDGVPLYAAITGNKIGGSVYWWNGMTYDSWTILGNNPRIEPWKGYWIVNLDTVDHQLTITDSAPAAE